MMTEHHVTMQLLAEQISRASLDVLFGLIGTGPLDPDVWGRDYCWCPQHQLPGSADRITSGPAARLVVAPDKDPDTAVSWVCTEINCGVQGTRESLARILLESPTMMDELLWAVREAAREAS